MLSQQSNSSDEVSPELFSQKSNTSPSRHTNPERVLNFQPTPEHRSKRTSRRVRHCSSPARQKCEKKTGATKSSPYPQATLSVLSLCSFCQCKRRKRDGLADRQHWGIRGDQQQKVENAQLQGALAGSQVCPPACGPKGTRHPRHYDYDDRWA